MNTSNNSDFTIKYGFLKRKPEPGTTYEQVWAERGKKEAVFGLDHCWVKRDKSIFVCTEFSILWHISPPFCLFSLHFKMKGDAPQSCCQRRGWVDQNPFDSTPHCTSSNKNHWWWASSQASCHTLSHIGTRPLPTPHSDQGEECEGTEKEGMTQKVQQRWEKGIDRRQANRLTRLLFSAIENLTL